MHEWEKRFEDIMDEVHGRSKGEGTEYQSGNTTYTYGGKYKTNGESKADASGYVTKKFLAIILAISIVVSGGVGACVSVLVSNGTTTRQVNNKTIITNNYDLVRATGSELTIQEIALMNEKSVVAITTEAVTTSNYWFGSSYVTQGAGSGVVYSKDGYILTNNHVIEKAKSITVTLSDGTEYPATIVATDSYEDVAVIKIDAQDLTPVTFASIDTVAVGDLAVAIGNPLGTLSGTVTVGVVSALERDITVDGKKMSLIQTSAAINPGNSGGGLFNQYGELIGLVVAKSKGESVEGLGFAIPCDKVFSVAESLIRNGYVAGRPQAGINILDVTSPYLAMQYGLSYTGVYITEVTGKNAKEAGLESGDLVYEIDGEKVTDSAMLIATIRSHKIGEEVTFTIVRGREMKQISVVLEEATAQNKENKN